MTTPTLQSMALVSVPKALCHPQLNQEAGFLPAPSSPSLNLCPGADFVCYPGERHVQQQWTSVPYPPRERSPRPDVEGDGNLLEASLQIK